MPHESARALSLFHSKDLSFLLLQFVEKTEGTFSFPSSFPFQVHFFPLKQLDASAVHTSGWDSYRTVVGNMTPERWSAFPNCDCVPIRVFTIRFTGTIYYCSWMLKKITPLEQYFFIWIGVILQEQFTPQSIDLGMNGQAMSSTNSNQTIRDRAPSINGPDGSSQSAFNSLQLIAQLPFE